MFFNVINRFYGRWREAELARHVVVLRVLHADEFDSDVAHKSVTDWVGRLGSANDVFEGLRR
jgi:hypothetical protein